MDRRSLILGGAALVGATGLTATGLGAASATTPQTVDGVVNFRGVQGFRTATGRVVRDGLVYRSGALNAVTPTGLTQLQSLRVAKIFDFRTDIEKQYFGVDIVPPGATDTAVPVSGTGDLNSPPEAQYAAYVSDAASRASFAAALRSIGSFGFRAHLIHCTVGVNRTGWETAVLLTILGVGSDQIYADYLASNASFGSEVAKKEHLDIAFAQVTSSYGNFDRFVREGLKLSLGEVIRLRATMTR